MNEIRKYGIVFNLEDGQGFSIKTEDGKMLIDGTVFNIDKYFAVRLDKLHKMNYDPLWAAEKDIYFELIEDEKLKQKQKHIDELRLKISNMETELKELMDNY